MLINTVHKRICEKDPMEIWTQNSCPFYWFWNYKSLLSEITLGVGLWHANFLHTTQFDTHSETRIPIRLDTLVIIIFLSLSCISTNPTSSPFPPRLYISLCVWAAQYIHTQTQQTFASASLTYSTHFSSQKKKLKFEGEFIYPKRSICCMPMDSATAQAHHHQVGRLRYYTPLDHAFFLVFIFLKLR